VAHQHSDLGNWIRQLREPDPGLTMKDALDAIDAEALDNAVGFAAEHCRRYIATGGEDDGWEGPRPILILYTTGRRTGKTRRNPLLFFDHNGHRYLVASNGGADANPSWFNNLIADPRVHVRVMADVYEAKARLVDPQERSVAWPALGEGYPMFGEYEQDTTRVIPLIELVPTPGVKEGE
jgi:deazaflavin-dependent oxidoreductase (nitroreductase family)